MKVFLDHASTTPVRQSALDALVAALADWKPAVRSHSRQTTRAHLEDARDDLALALDCNRSEVVFNSVAQSQTARPSGYLLGQKPRPGNTKVIISSPV